MITDEDIIWIMREKHKLLIGDRTAKELLEKLRLHPSGTLAVRGRSLETGLGLTVEVPASDFVKE
jgi:actin-like ATPase involved in cell morphogenesis